MGKLAPKRLVREQTEPADCQSGLSKNVILGFRFIPVSSTDRTNFVKVMNMSIQKAYNDWSETYDTDENLTRDLDQKVTRELLVNLHFNSILEIGCGTGKNTSFLVQIGQSRCLSQVHCRIA